MNVLSQLNTAISKANGRRRERLLSSRDLVVAAMELENGQHVFLHGGHVPNSYKYRAVATIAVVWKDAAGKAWAIIREGNATQGSTGFGKHSSWIAPEDMTNSVSVPDLHSLTGLDCDDLSILADALDDLGHAELATSLR